MSHTPVKPGGGPGMRESFVEYWISEAYPQKSYIKNSVNSGNSVNSVLGGNGVSVPFIRL